MKALLDLVPKEGRGWIAAVLLGVFYATGMNERLLKSIHEATKEPAPGAALATREYVDTRWNDLNALSIQRNTQAMEALKAAVDNQNRQFESFQRVQNQTSEDVRSIGKQLYDLAVNGGRHTSLFSNAFVREAIFRSKK